MNNFFCLAIQWCLQHLQHRIGLLIVFSNNFEAQCWMHCNDIERRLLLSSSRHLFFSSNEGDVTVTCSIPYLITWHKHNIYYYGWYHTTYLVIIMQQNMTPLEMCDHRRATDNGLLIFHQLTTILAKIEFMGVALQEFKSMLQTCSWPWGGLIKSTS